MLVGHPPFTGDSTEVASAKSVRAAPRVRGSRDDVPEHVATTIDAMLARNPSTRPSMVEVLERLAPRESVAPAPGAVPAAARRRAPTTTQLHGATSGRGARELPIALVAVAVLVALVLAIWKPWEAATRASRHTPAAETVETAPAAAAPPASVAQPAAAARQPAPPAAVAPPPVAPAPPPATAASPAAVAPPPVATAPPPRPPSPTRRPVRPKPAPAPQPSPAPDIQLADPYGAQ
jgi:hypothetical protein